MAAKTVQLRPYRVSLNERTNQIGTFHTFSQWGLRLLNIFHRLPMVYIIQKLESS